MYFVYLLTKKLQKERLKQNQYLRVSFYFYNRTFGYYVRHNYLIYLRTKDV